MTPTPLTKAEREELRRLHDAATMGPWHRDPLYWSLRIVEKGGSDVADGLPDDTRWPRRDDAGYICASHDALPRLLADLGAANGQCAAEIIRKEIAISRADAAEAQRDAAETAESRAWEQRNGALAQRDRAEAELDAERKMRVEAEAAAKRADDERDALKAKLDDPRRVLIHETEVVATKEEIASLKTRLADLSEADEELHTCRALVNATSENLSVDLERMVDDLAEANEKAARSEKDSHSWHDLYEDTKAKLAALVAAVDTEIDNVDHENYPLCGVHDGSRLIGRHLNGAECTCGVQKIRNAIAAARGGA